MNLAKPPQKYDPSEQAQMRAELVSEDRQNFKKGRDVRLLNGERFTLKSPDGSEWSLTIDNAGATTWTKL